MNRWISGWLIGMLLFTATVVGGEPLKVVIISGSGEYETFRFLPAYRDYLEQNYNIRVVYLESNSTVEKPGNHVPGLEALEHTDTVLLYTRRLALEG